jgi:hypothetical protein
MIIIQDFDWGSRLHAQRRLDLLVTGRKELQYDTSDLPPTTKRMYRVITARTMLMLQVLIHQTLLEDLPIHMKPAGTNSLISGKEMT